MFLNMSNSCLEIVYEGWLTKSPPTKSIWKARWRKRWFVLRHSGELPGQYFLLYYTDRNCRKLKGTIDLDQCEQVDAGLRFENNKQNYPHMFDVKTHKRTYYLAADSEADMNRWVDCICQVCGLKASNDETSVEFTEETNDSLLTQTDRVDTESPPVSPASTVSGPYIPISECISGKPLNTALGLTDFKNILSKQGLALQSENRAKCNSKDSLNKLNQVQTMKQNNASGNDINLKKTLYSDDISKCDNNKPVTLVMAMSSVERLNSMYGDKNIIMSKENLENCHKNAKVSNLECAKKIVENVTSDEYYDSPRKIFLDVRDGNEIPPPNWETFPNDFTSSDIGSWSVQKCCGKLQVVETKAPIVTNSLHRNLRHRHELDTMSLRRPPPPPRPPKPSHLVLTNDVVGVDNQQSPCTPPNSAKEEDVNVVSDDFYDFPRSHQPTEGNNLTLNRHNYSNAAPGKCENVFRYDFTDNVIEQHGVEPISPRSEGSGVVYSNLPSPLVTSTDIPTPPAVNRELKPCRKLSDSGASNEPSPGGPLTSPTFSLPEPSPTSTSYNNIAPPSIDRKLKPRKMVSEGTLKLAPPPDGSLRKVRAAPSPTPPFGSMKNGKTRPDCSSSEEDPRYSPDDEQIYFYEGTINSYIPVSKRVDTTLQYIDLDLETDGHIGTSPSLLPCAPGGCGMSSLSSVASISSALAPTATVYKTVDFLKTEAFNRTRQKVEEERKQCVNE